MARSRSPSRRSGGRDSERRNYRDNRDRDRDRDRRDGNASHNRNGRGGDQNGRGGRRRDEGRLTPPATAGRDNLTPPRSNDRKRSRSRSRSPHRHRDGGRYGARGSHRDGHGYRDDSRERKRFRGNDHEDTRRPGRDRDHSRDSRPYKSRRQLEEEVGLDLTPHSRPVLTTNQAAEAARKAEEDEQREAEEEEKCAAEELKAKHLIRQARLAKMKERLAAEEAAAQAADKAKAEAAAVEFQAASSPGAVASPADDEPSKPFAGKFDHKAIARKAALAKSKLEGNVLGSSEQNGSAHTSQHVSGIQGGALRSTKKAASAISRGFGASGGHAPQPSGTARQTIDLAGDRPSSRTGKSNVTRFGGRLPPATASTSKDNEEDEVDPLDAFMDALESGPKRKSTTRTNKLRGPEIAFDDDEVINAVGDEDDKVMEAAAAAKKKKKEIPKVDHAKMDYEPFRKNFYTEPLEVKEMTPQEVKTLRFELDDIKVNGKNVPKPVQKFAQFGLGTHVLDTIRGLGFEKPTSIQAQAIPAIMSGRDVIGVAKTGSGKTVAFLLPMFRHIKDQRDLKDQDGPIGLIIAPTRELAAQIYDGCKPFLKSMRLRAVCASGGGDMSQQIAALKKGAHIVVATPGRLIDLLSANSGRVIPLSRVTYVVMDEADRMFDMGFEPQIALVMANVRPSRQCVLFSATFPKKMEELAKKQLTDPIQITVGGRSSVPKDVTQIVEVLEEEKKMHRLLQLVSHEIVEQDDKRVLVFVEKQDTADTLMLKVQRTGYPCVAVHGGREQADRDDALEDFKSGAVPIMIATSVAARGLDVKQLTLVVNFDVPSHMEDYVHRCGRTGRAGNKGTAVTFITPEQDNKALDIVKAFKQSDTPVPSELQGLADSFQVKVDNGTAERFGGGFGGHGLDKFSAHKDMERQLQNARLKKDYAVEGEAEEEEVKPIAQAIDEPIKVMARGETAPTPAPVAYPDKPSEKAPSKAATEEPPMDSRFGGEIKVQRTEKPKPSASVGGGGGMTKLQRAAAAAAAINARMSVGGTARSGASIDNRGPDAGEYHYKLEINDLSQKARWAVTNRSNLAKVLESTGVSITTKGQYYPRGVEPKTGELPKMSVLVEGDTELVVTTAVRELQRLLREAQLAEAEAPQRVGGGRYTVV